MKTKVAAAVAINSSSKELISVSNGKHCIHKHCSEAECWLTWIRKSAIEGVIVIDQ